MPPATPASGPVVPPTIQAATGPTAESTILSHAESGIGAQAPGAPVAAPGSRDAEVTGKLARARTLLASHGAGALVLTRVDNFAWVTGGGRSFISSATDTGAAWAVITPDRSWIVTSNIEAARIAEEEVAGAGWEVLPYPWWGPGPGPALRASLDAVHASGPLLADGPLPGAIDVAAEIAALRVHLGPEEQHRAAAAGRDTAEALEACCRALQPGDTEFATVGRLAAECYARGIEPVVHLVAADERARSRRHPLPTMRRIEAYALVVVCGMREGLVLSATRLVHFGPPPEDLTRRWRAAAHVDAAMIANSRPGRTAGEVFATAQQAYRQAGFPDEWRLHHQGGLTGYASREWRATPGGHQTIQAGQMLAWNPSVAGAKSEDTILVLDQGLPQVLTRSGQWPEIEIETQGGWRVARPAILTVV